MKRYLLLSFVLTGLISINVFSQIPNAFHYQAVIRDNSNELVKNQQIKVRIGILEESETATAVYSEVNTVTTNDYGMINLKVGLGEPNLIMFSEIDWSITPKYIKVEIDIQGGTNFVHIGTSELLSVPYAIQAKSAKSMGNTAHITDSDTLFVVKDNLGRPVFAVFPDGVKVIVDQTAKGAIGGFAVSGRTTGKATDENIFTVTPDSTRIYIKEGITKGAIGGFAVSGRTSGKAAVNEILTVNSDSTRIYVNDNAKGSIGGFAVSGRTTGKNSSSYMNVNKVNYFIGHNSGSRINTGQFNSILGYESGLSITDGSSNAFLGYQSGYSTQTGSGNLLLGYQSGYSNIVGNYNTFIGYQAGYANFDGTNNSFLGSFTGKNNISGSYNTFVGDSTGFNNTYGNNNAFIGTKVGFHNKIGWGNSYFGNFAGFNSNGSENVFIGDHSGYSNIDGGMNVFIGNESGYSNASGWNNIYLGTDAGYTNTEGSGNVIIGFQAGMNNTSGTRNIFIGNRAGMNEQGSSKLIIDNTDKDSTDVFIWGDFNSRFLRFNAKLGIGTNPSYGTNLSIYQPDAPAVINLLGVGNAYDYAQIRLQADTGTDTLGYQLIHDIDGRFRILRNDGTNLFPRLGIDVTGKVMIGGVWVDATEMLDVDGNARFRAVASGAYANDLNITSDGTLTTSSSDKRLKQNIQPLGSTVNKLKQLNGYTFNWKRDNKSDIGLIAQEVQTIFPKLVFENKTDGYLGINYSRFHAIYIEAFKEQQMKIESQQTEIEELKKAILEMQEILKNINK